MSPCNATMSFIEDLRLLSEELSISQYFTPREVKVHHAGDEVKLELRGGECAPEVALGHSGCQFACSVTSRARDRRSTWPLQSMCNRNFAST